GRPWAHRGRGRRAFSRAVARRHDDLLRTADGQRLGAPRGELTAAGFHGYERGVRADAARPSWPDAAPRQSKEEVVTTILIGVNDSESSEDAVALGRRLAEATSGRVVVACAFPYSDMPSRAANLTYRDALKTNALRT